MDEKMGRLGLMPASVAVVVTGVATLALCQSRTGWLAIWLISVGLLVRDMKSRLCRIVTASAIVAPLPAGTTSMIPQGEDEFQLMARYWFQDVCRPTDAAIPHARNMVEQTDLDVGVVGSAAYCGAMALLSGRAVRSPQGLSSLTRSASVGSAVSLVAVSLFGLPDAVPPGPKLGMSWWIASGLSLAASRTRSVLTQ
jgi:hypothetical protein